METKSNVFNGEFIPYIVKWGRATNLIGCVVLFIPCVVLLCIGAVPPWAAVVSGTIMQLSMSATFYVVEPISYFTVLGIPGTYMSFLSGNISNMRVPAAIVSQRAAGVEPGSDEGTIISTIGVAISIVFNALVLTLCVIGGTALINALPPSITKMFDYLLPALFGSMFASNLVAQPRIAILAIPVGLVMTILYRLGALDWIPSAFRSAVVILAAVFGGIGICFKCIGFIEGKKKA